ncbi:hypothetical protein K458DRAFT_381977 [Lentithecium fluviatile CBS 122367]|uniref:Fungal calcium binding protein domain-containing protein n=1 Tax=Lentithecium fluviatile CBS 122367 TaxID=1168545 RepID=A0A6G1JPI8_9PLEO|nr:hypothetical protein K458DRAFT_381977 [Lentithecium fluviatile CBS 122367]
MLSKTALLALCLLVSSSVALPSLQARQSTANGCPTDTEYACFDVINSSLCVSQRALQNGTAEQLANCVSYPGGMSDLPGASKLCRCPGCHSKPINDVIAKLFPPPCA